MLTSSMMTQFFKVLEERKKICLVKGTSERELKKSTVASYWTNLNSFL
jgi:hypothetical protein